MYSFRSSKNTVWHKFAIAQINEKILWVRETHFIARRVLNITRTAGLAVVGFTVHNGIFFDVVTELHGGDVGCAHAARDREARRTEAQRRGSTGTTHTPHWERQASIIAEARRRSSLDSSSSAAVATTTTTGAFSPPFQYCDAFHIEDDLQD